MKKFLVVSLCVMTSLVMYLLYVVNSFSPHVQFPNDLDNIQQVDSKLYQRLIAEVGEHLPRISRYYVRSVSIGDTAICVRFQRLEHLQDAFIEGYYNRITTASDYDVLFSRMDSSYVGLGSCLSK